MRTSYKQIFDHLALPCCVIGNDGQVIAWNRALSEVSAVSTRQAVGQPLASLGEFASLLYEQLQYRVDDNSVIRPVTIGEYSYLPAFSPIPELGWSIVLEACQPLTLKGKRSDLISTVSHDLKSPLSAMHGYLSLVENQGTLTDKQKQFVDRLYLSIEEMLDMIENLLNMAWIDAGMKLEIVDVDLSHIARHVADKYVELARNQHIDFKMEIQQVPPVHGDERRLKQVVDNLISNAIKYSPDGGTVTVTVNEAAGQVTFSVSDTGIGIEQEHHDKIFKRFFRVNTPQTQRIKGSGLGLAISYDIIRQHGSKLHVESTPGNGSRFYFSLPV